MSEITPIEKVKTPDGEEHKVAFKMNVKNRMFIVTLDRQVLEQDEDGNIIKCSAEDEDAKVFYEYLKPAESLDIDNGDINR